MQILIIGEFSFDEARLELRRGAERIPVQPKVFQVLLHLARQHGRTVTKDELLRGAWPEETVTDGSIKRAIHCARKVLGDDGDSQCSIRTVRGQGYRLVLPVTAVTAVPA